MRPTIAVIGMGALGKRHLESILKAPIPLDIYCVDVNADAINGFSTESIAGHRVIFSTDITVLPASLDWVLLATTSAARRMLFDAVVAHSTVKYMVFEKVLFQKVEDYEHVERRLKELGIKAWVNCPRREQNSWQAFRARLSQEGEFTVNISGSSWGLACNCVHMLDLVQYLSAPAELENVEAKFDEQIIDSKRAGYKEVNGSVRGHCGRCTNFTIVCLPSGTDPLTIEVVTSRASYRIEEGRGKITINSGDSVKELPFEMKYQSQLTQQVLMGILSQGTCELATYEESKRIHLALINPIIEFFESKGMEAGICPIT